jgi:hypothetical protein
VIDRERSGAAGLAGVGGHCEGVVPLRARGRSGRIGRPAGAAATGKDACEGRRGDSRDPAAAVGAAKPLALREVLETP